MYKSRKRSLSWLVVVITALLALSACTTTSGGDEPAVAEEAATAVETTRQPEVTAETETEPTEPTTEEPTSSPEATAETEPSNAMTTESGEVILKEDDRSQRLRSVTSSWDTNWNKHLIEYDELLSGGPPRDGIPSIDDPQFISPEEASEWLADNEPVISLGVEGEARAYPLQILTWHEIVNDTVGGVPIAVTFCPLCNSAIVFDRRVEGQVLEFGTSGLLRNSDLVMYDRTTESLWQQLTGKAIVGDMVGTELDFLAASIISFADFREAHPDGVVLSRDTGFNRRYGENPYAGYDTVGQNPFLFRGDPDGRLPAMERVVAVTVGGEDIAYPFSTLSEAGVINDTRGGQDLVVFHKSGTSSALGAATIANARDVGATGVFDPHVDGRKLTFRKEDEKFVDEETGSTWNIEGEAVAGSLEGTQLEPIVHADHFWFAWAAFKPDTTVYEG